MSLALLRAGKQQEVKITPAKQPEEIPAEALPRSEESARQAFRRWVEGMAPGGAWPPSVRFHVIGPGRSCRRAPRRGPCPTT